MKPELGHAPHQLRGIAVLLVDLGGLGQHLAAREVARGLLDELMLLAQREVHLVLRWAADRHSPLALIARVKCQGEYTEF